MSQHFTRRRGLGLVPTGAMLTMALQDDATREAAASLLQSATSTADAPLVAVGKVENAMPAIRQMVKDRVQGGRLVWLSNKNPCNAGTYGDDFSKTKTWFGDPSLCQVDRDRVEPPVLRVDMGCDYGQLFWPDIYLRAKTEIGRLLASQPGHREAWPVRFKWTRLMMELVSIALEATNIQPIFMFPAKWATQDIYRAMAGDGTVVPWGLETAGWTYDGRTSPDPATNTGDSRCLGYNIPREVWQHITATTRQVVTAQGGTMAPRPLPDCAVTELPYTLEQWGGRKMPFWSGPHSSREGPGIRPIGPWIAPAMMAGSCITANTQMARALRDGDHDPFQWRRGAVPHEAVLSAYSGGSSRTSKSAATEALKQQIKAGNLIRPMETLFRVTQGEPTTIGPAWCLPSQLHFHATAGLSVEGEKQNQLFPNSQWFVEHAAVWGRVIASRSFGDLIVDPMLFYLVNHTAAFKRILGDASSFPVEELVDLANQVNRNKSALIRGMASAGAQMITSLAGPIVGAVVATAVNGIMDEMQKVLHFPQYPKSLFRRVPQDLTCDITPGGAGGLDAALSRMGDVANAATDAANRTAPENPTAWLDALRDQPRREIPWLGLGVAGAVLVGGAVLLRRR